jgi:cellulose biosynthesis protein BcsQ
MKIKDKNIKIVITNEKGGTGKSTILALLVEYLNY